MSRLALWIKWHMARTTVLGWPFRPLWYWAVRRIDRHHDARTPLTPDARQRAEPTWGFLLGYLAGVISVILAFGIVVGIFAALGAWR